MKNKTLYLLIFLYNALLYSQQDTITVQENDIITVEKEIYTHNPRTGVYSTKYYALKGSVDSLKGFYKIVKDNNHFYTCYFEKGIKSLNKETFYNVVKYYEKDKDSSAYKVYKIDVYFPYFLSNSIYYTTDTFDCKAKKIIINQIDIWSNQIMRTFYVKQRIKKNSLEWIFKGKSSGTISFPKKGICEPFK